MPLISAFFMTFCEQTIVALHTEMSALRRFTEWAQVIPVNLLSYDDRVREQIAATKVKIYQGESAIFQVRPNLPPRLDVGDLVRMQLHVGFPEFTENPMSKTQETNGKTVGRWPKESDLAPGFQDPIKFLKDDTDFVF